MSQMLKYLLVILPILEIAGFIIVGRMIGVLPTLFLIIGTSVWGAAILKGRGLKPLRDIQKPKNTVTPAIFETPIILLAGFFLLIPGFITDLIGCLLIIAPIRRVVVRWWILSVVTHDTPHAPPSASRPKAAKSSSDRVIEGEFKREKDEESDGKR